MSMVSRRLQQVSGGGSPAMPPEYIDHTTLSSYSGDRSVPMPSYSDGDRLIFVVCQDGSSISLPLEWGSSIVTETYPGRSKTLSVYTKVADNEPTTLDVSVGVNNTMYLISLRNPSTNPLGLASPPAIEDVVTAPIAATATSESFLLTAWYNRQSPGTPISYDNHNITSTIQAPLQSQSGYGHYLGVAIGTVGTDPSLPLVIPFTGGFEQAAVTMVLDD